MDIVLKAAESAQSYNTENDQRFFISIYCWAIIFNLLQVTDLMEIDIYTYKDWIDKPKQPKLKLKDIKLKLSLL